MSRLHAHIDMKDCNSDDGLLANKMIDAQIPQLSAGYEFNLNRPFSI